MVQVFAQVQLVLRMNCSVCKFRFSVYGEEMGSGSFCSGTFSPRPYKTILYLMNLWSPDRKFWNRSRDMSDISSELDAFIVILFLNL